MSKYQIIGFQITAIAALALCGASVGYSQSTPKLTGEDYIEIQNLYATYTHALDEGKGEVLAATFTENGEFTGQSQPGQPRRQPVTGKEALTRMGGRGGGGSRHFIANLSVTPTPEGAKASAYFIQYNTRDTPPSIFLMALYDDTLVKTPQGWKFSKRVVYRDDDEMSPFKANPAAPGGGGGRGRGGRGQGGGGQGGGDQAAPAQGGGPAAAR